jgi:energy-coupling factor transporter ATP-binding protein EcfA2
MAIRSEPISFIDDDDFDSLKIVRRVVFSISRKFQSSSMVAVFGTRGSGRTSLINMCRNFSEHNSPTVDHKIAMWFKPFEAWRLAGMGNLTQALLWHIHKSLPEIAAKDEKVLYKLGRISVALSTLIGTIQPSGITQLANSDSVRNFDLISKSLSPDRKSAISSQFSACEQIDELSELFSSLGKHLCGLCGCNVLVVPIDDLDRCTPVEAMQLLFALRTMITGESFSFVIAADKFILSKFCNYGYGSMFSEKQAQDSLLSFFNDWVYLPSPPLMSVLKKVDFPLSVRDEFFNELKTNGLPDIFPMSSPVIQGCKRFELFIYNETSRLDCTAGDYCGWLGWFLISEIQPGVIQEIIQSERPEEFFKPITDLNPEKKPVNLPEEKIDISARISIGQRKARKNSSGNSSYNDILIRFKHCMETRMGPTVLILKLREIYPFL